MAIHYEEGEHVFLINRQGWSETKTPPPRPMLVFNGDPIFRVTKDADGTEQFEPVHKDQQYDRRIQVVIDQANEQSLDYAMLKLRYAGFDGDSFANLNLEGREVRAICSYAKYKDKDIENWDFALPPRENTTQTLDSAAARRLDALFGKRLKNGASPSPKPSPAPEDRREVIPRKPEHAAAYDAQKPPPEEREREGVHVSTADVGEVPF